MGLFLLVFEKSGRAIVGQAERYDEFKQEDLDEFHDNLVHEEKKQQFDRADDASRMLRLKQKQFDKTEGVEKVVFEKDIEQLKKELLSLPKRDRFRFEQDAQYSFDSNINRNPINSEKSDSVLDASDAFLIDLSGKKTDLRLESRAGKQWNIKFPKKDFWLGEERIRYRRKYLKKITHSFQSMIRRHNSKTVEMNDRKVRWDAQQNTSFNYLVSRKFAVNSEFEMVKHLFTTEAFDQDSNWEASAAPSAFWIITPKSRLSAGYRFGANRIRSKTGDANAQEIHLGYFGQVTRKSSGSLDFAFTHQTPRSRDTATVNTVTTGVGYVLQLTPKSQMTVQLLRSMQNSTSNTITSSDTSASSIAAADAAGTDQTAKSTTHFTHDSITLSFNSRLTSKMTGILVLNGSHFSTHVAKGGSKDNETMQISFPISLSVTYFLQRWINMTLGYTFAYRVADEKPDNYRSHAVVLGMHFVL